MDYLETKQMQQKLLKPLKNCTNNCMNKTHKNNFTKVEVLTLNYYTFQSDSGLTLAKYSNARHGGIFST